MAEMGWVVEMEVEPAGATRRLEVAMEVKVVVMLMMEEIAAFDRLRVP